MRLGGWQRLWVVISGLWVGGIVLAHLNDYPTPALYQAQAERAYSIGRPDSAEHEGLRHLAETQSTPAQLHAYRVVWVQDVGLLALLLPATLAIAMALVAWIRRGFGRADRSAKTTL